MRVLTILFLLTVVPFSFGQAVLYDANDLYEEEQFYEAIPLYEKAFKRKQTYECASKLGFSFLYLKNINQAQYWLEKALEYNEHDPVINKVLGELHKQKEEYAKAKLYFEAWGREDAKQNRIAKQYAQSCISLLAKKHPNGGFKIQSLDELNTTYDEFSPAWFEGQIVFSSDRMKEGNPEGKEINGQTGTPFQSMYTTTLIEGFYTTPKSIWDEHENQLHEGPKCFTENGEVYFTSVPRNAKIDSNVIPLDIYVGRRVGNSIEEVKPFEHNEENFSEGHPYVSRDGERLYFVSDRESGYGGTDIYICYKNADGWSAPLNMGPAINSEFDERFPFERSEKELYFSSNRPSSLGGLDVYRSRKSAGLWQLATNMGAPLNSPRDDFGILFYPGTDKGIFSSNRSGGKGNDDLYGFNYIEALDFYINDAGFLAGLNADTAELDLGQFSPNELDQIEEDIRLRKLAQVQENNELKKSVRLKKEDFEIKEGDISGTIEIRNMQLIEDEEDSCVYITGQIVEILDNGNIIPAKETEVMVYNKVTGQPAIAQTDDYGQFILKGSQKQGEPTNKIRGFNKDGEPVDVYPEKPDGSRNPIEKNIAGYDKGGEPIFKSKLNAPYDPNAMLGYDAYGSPIFKTKQAQTLYFNPQGNPVPNQVIQSQNPEFNDLGFLVGADIPEASNQKIDFNVSPTKKEYYNLRANKSGYFSKGIDFTIDPLSSRVTVTDEQDVLININYDFNDYRLTKDAINILEEVIVFLKKHDNLDVILRSYTDLRGSDAYNQSLSVKRAKAVKAYLILNGIKESRLVSLGMGESNPILQNAQTDEEHRVNRRTEFELINRKKR